MNLWRGIADQDYTLWIRVHTDPVAEFRGFSIANKEFRVEGFAPFEDEMVDSQGNRIPGKYWKVRPVEVFRVVPELLQLKYGELYQDRPWLFPVEFCESFPRPRDFLKRKINDIILR